MTTWTLSRVRASGEGYLRELGRARLAQLSGRAGASPGEVREAYRHELGRDAIDLALEYAETSSPDSADARSGRALLAWLVGLDVHDVRAPIDQWVADWAERATVRTADARVVAFPSVEREIARESNRTMRLQLDGARVDLVKRDLASTIIERSARERDAIERLDIASSLREVAERLTGDDLVALADNARQALAQSVDSWRDSLRDRLRRDMAVPLAEARPADIAAATDASLFDGAFRASDREATCRRVLIDLGLDPEMQGRLRIEKFARMQGSRAEAVAVDVPAAIHIVFGEHGGVAGQRATLHALGEALRFAQVEADAAFEHRWLGDGAVHQMCGRVLSSLLVDDGWLMRYADLSRTEARRLARITALAALHELRHACALHLHYIESIDAAMTVGADEELYAEIVGSVIGVRPHGVDALLDAPPVLAPGVRLRGIQGASVLAHELVQRFDVDWYRNPRAGLWLAQALFVPARGETTAEMIKSAMGRELSLAPCIDRLERILAA